MTDKITSDPKAKPAAADTPAPAGKKDDTELSDEALKKVTGGRAVATQGISGKRTADAPGSGSAS